MKDTVMRQTMWIGVIALSLAGGGPSACARREQLPTAITAREPIAVVVTAVVAADIAERLDTGGVVAARESATVSSRIVATIGAVQVRAGDRVRKGDVLVTLDARDAVERTGEARAGSITAERALARARAEKEAAEAEHRLAAAWEKRITQLHAGNSATDQERDEAEARLAAAAAHLAGAQGAIEEADAHLAAARAAVGVASATESLTTLRAPFDGRVTERLTDPGNLAAPGVPLLRLDADGARQVVVRMDEARMPYAHVGDRVSVVIDAADEDASAGIRVDGVVAEVAREVGVDQRAFTVKVTVPPSLAARSGSFARVVFRGASHRALTVPVDAVQRQGQISSVFVVQNGVARLRLVHAGTLSPDGVEVLAGLDAGESIVVSPVRQLVDGDKVTTSLWTGRVERTP
jgi:RND family efflux transporter MFP subunit